MESTRREVRARHAVHLMTPGRNAGGAVSLVGTNLLACLPAAQTMLQRFATVSVATSTPSAASLSSSSSLSVAPSPTNTLRGRFYADVQAPGSAAVEGTFYITNGGDETPATSSQHTRLFHSDDGNQCAWFYSLTPSAEMIASDDVNSNVGDVGHAADETFDDDNIATEAPGLRLASLRCHVDNVAFAQASARLVVFADGDETIGFAVGALNDLRLLQAEMAPPAS
jgi:hypothetical protein